MIVILSHQKDPSTVDVVEWLVSLGKPYLRIDSDSTEIKFISYNEENGELLFSKNGKVVNLFNADSLWYRRRGFSTENINYNKFLNNPVFFNDHSTHIQHLKEEFFALRDLLYSSLRERCQKTLGNNENSTLNKIIVLNLAKKIGLKVPKSIIITQKVDLLELLETNDNYFITKSIGDGVYNLTKKFGYYSYTERLTLQKARDFPNTFFPSLVQPEIKKKYELRVFYLKEKFYSMAIMSQRDKQTTVDFRKYNQRRPNRTIPYALPLDIQDKLRIILDELNLDTGSIDFIVDEHDNFIFLEINPVGQFSMTSDPCNYYLEKVIAEIL